MEQIRKCDSGPESESFTKTFTVNCIKQLKQIVYRLRPVREMEGVIFQVTLQSADVRPIRMFYKEPLRSNELGLKRTKQNS